MKLGIFAKTFVRPTFEATLDAVAEHGLTEVQFNLSCCGLPTVPETVPAALVRDVRQAFERRGLSMAALSATFNLIHPDPVERASGLSRLDGLTRVAGDLGTRLLTLCTGSRDAANMWRGHPENATQSAWEDLLRSMETALTSAARANVVLGVEPELSNVVDSASRARRLLDHFRSPHLKIVIDPANLFPAGTLPQMTAILSEAFDLLGSDTVLAHAKDLRGDGGAGDQAAGTGVLDYDLYLDLLAAQGYRGALILHGLTEAQVGDSVRFLRKELMVRSRSRGRDGSI